MSAAQWSTRQTNGGFSVSFFWLSSTKGGTGQNKLRNRKRRHKRDRQKSTKPTLLPSATVEHDTHPAPVKQSSGSRTPTPINASQSAHARSPSPPNLLAATVPHIESQQSQGSDSSETSSHVKPTSQDNDWTLVSPRRRTTKTEVKYSTSSVFQNAFSPSATFNTGEVSTGYLI